MKLVNLVRYNILLIKMVKYKILQILEGRSSMKYQIKQLSALVRMHDWPPFAIFAHDGIGHEIITSGWFENQLIDFLETHIFPSISPNSIALDIGANIGNHSNRFANYFKKGSCF